MSTRKLIYSIAIFACVFSFTSCSNNEDVISDVQEQPHETRFPVIIDENTSQKQIVVNGRTYTFNIHQGKRETKGVANETIYPRDPNATLASVPVQVSQGEYKKYAVGTFPPFAELAGASVVMLRLNKFTFECTGPANAKPMSFDITNITKQGFATESAKLKGFSIDQILTTTTGVIVKCSFYIQDGIAYNLLGQQLTGNTYYPLPGDQVRYQFTYETR